MNKTAFKIIQISLILFCSAPGYAQAPHLEKRGAATQLIVNGKPFIVLGGELHNSSSSSLDYLDPLWAPIRKMNLNTVLSAVSWELIEPQEGKFDFTLVDGALKGARANNLKLVLLWFGSWKNGLSHYPPEWVKRDTKRFPRVVLKNGKPIETISPLSTEAMKADATAFAALMRHVKEVDDEQTVIMIQVQNEVGVIGSTRDHSAFASAAFATPVPNDLLKGLQKNKAELQPALKKLWEANGSKTSGNWSAVFGNTPGADEAFMAWHYATYVNTVALAGKAAYNIPMFVNAWIVQPADKQPGDYPGGGPQAHVHDIWRIGAPAIDIQAPDVYLPDFKRIAAEYHHAWNPLFIPESFSGLQGAANAFYAIGHHKALGYSPFGIDAKMDDPHLPKAYKVLDDLTPEITVAQQKNSIAGIWLQMPDSVQKVNLGGYEITATLRKNWSGVLQATKGYGIIIQSGADSFTVAGSNIDITFLPTTSGPTIAGIASLWEGSYVNGAWKRRRLLNGDNIMVSYKLADEAAANRTGTGVHLLEEPGVLKVKLYRFE